MNAAKLKNIKPILLNKKFHLVAIENMNSSLVDYI